MSSALSAEAAEEHKTTPPPLVTEKLESEKPESLRKRGRDLDPASAGDPRPDPDGELGPPPPKRSVGPHEVVFRIVVPSRQVGRVIGKGGCRIKQIRVDTGATIKIAGAITQHEERVIIISSRDDESGISNAETALYSVARVILKVSDDANMIRLLIAGSQAGCLIGVSGENIEHIRNYSGATITILAKNQLSSCASAHDREVQVSGNILEVLKALEKIGCKLRENPPTKVISIKPSYNYSAFTSDPPPHLPPSSAEHVTSEMMITEKLVGGLIGRNGYNISRIRNDTGATIKVSGVKDEGEQRLIYFEGNTEQVSLARMMVECCIFSQSAQQNPS